MCFRGDGSGTDGVVPIYIHAAAPPTGCIVHLCTIRRNVRFQDGGSGTLNGSASRPMSPKAGVGRSAGNAAKIGEHGCSMTIGQVWERESGGAAGGRTGGGGGAGRGAALLARPVA